MEANMDSGEDKFWGYIIFTVANILFVTSGYGGLAWLLLPMLEHENHPWITWPLTFIFTLSLVYSLYVYWRCSLGDPGFMPGDLQPPDFAYKEYYSAKCNKCKDAWKPPRAYHCKTCKRCVFKMDHHCVWVNNCVGAKNGKFFLQFVIAAFIYNLTFCIISALGLLNFFGFYGKVALVKLGTITPRQEFGFVFFIFYFIFGAIFTWFTYDFFEDFMYGVDRNQTTVENYKEIYGVKWDLSDLRSMYLGWDLWEWCIPLNPSRTHNYLEKTYTRAQIIDQVYTHEVKEIVKSREYENYYVFK